MLTAHQVAALEVLAEAETLGIAYGWLSDETVLRADKGDVLLNATTARALERRGLVEPHDRRREWTVKLTDDGRAALAAARDATR